MIYSMPYPLPPEPAAFSGTAIAQMSRLPVFLDVWAIMAPSGDQDGHHTPEPRMRGIATPELRDTRQTTRSLASGSVHASHRHPESSMGSHRCLDYPNTEQLPTVGCNSLCACPAPRSEGTLVTEPLPLAWGVWEQRRRWLKKPTG